MKRCGGCQNWLKWKNDPLGGGICLAKDGRTSSDSGSQCPLWKAIPYNRNKQKADNMRELEIR